MFQGYFLSKPEIIKGKKIAANQLAIINLIAEIQSLSVDMDGLTQIIASDPALSFQLLKLINSAAFKRRNTIDSIHRAVTLLGIDKIKSWTSLLALSKLDDKPEALHHIALVRAIMCEKLSAFLKPESKDQFYTVGLFSCLDAFFDQDIHQIIENIPLGPEVNNALLEHQGNAGLALDTTLHFENAQWHKLNLELLGKFGLNIKAIHEIYYESIQLALELSPKK